MTEVILSRYAGWSAYGSAAAMIVSAVSLLLFFNVGQPWGTISDITITVLAVLILDILLVLHRLHRHGDPTFSLIAYLIGVLGMIMAIGFQVLLVLRIYEPPELILPVGFGLWGVSLLLFSYLAFVAKTLPRGMVILGLIAGIGYALVSTGSITGDVPVPFSLSGILLAAIFYPLWAIWFGRLIFSGKLTM